MADETGTGFPKKCGYRPQPRHNPRLWTLITVDDVDQLDALVDRQSGDYVTEGGAQGLLDFLASQGEEPIAVITGGDVDEPLSARNWSDCPDCGLLGVINPATGRHEAGDGITAQIHVFDCPSVRVGG